MPDDPKSKSTASSKTNIKAGIGEAKIELTTGNVAVAIVALLIVGFIAYLWISRNTPSTSLPEHAMSGATSPATPSSASEATAPNAVSAPKLSENRPKAPLMAASTPTSAAPSKKTDELNQYSHGTGNQNTVTAHRSAPAPAKITQKTIGDHNTNSANFE